MDLAQQIQFASWLHIIAFFGAFVLAVRLSIVAIESFMPSNKELAENFVAAVKADAEWTPASIPGLVFWFVAKHD